MISAKDARVKTEESKKIVIEKELTKIEGLINTAIEKGESEVTCREIMEETKKKLKEFGYSVRTNDYCNDSFTDTYVTIRW